MAEEILDIFQRDLMKDERVQPLTRATSQIHVVEEARHMRFAREEVSRRAPALSGWQRRKQCTMVAAVAAIADKGTGKSKTGGSSQAVKAAGKAAAAAIGVFAARV